MTSASVEREVGADRRVRRTRRALAEALLALTLEREYEEVTIREIAARADIGYATFFRHYPDKDALLGDALDVVIDDVVALLIPAMTSTDPTALGTALFRYAGEHAALCRVLLRGRAATLLLARFGTNNPCQPAEWAPPPPPGIPAEIAAHHRITASLALLQWWLEGGMPYPAERMGEIYHDLIVRPTIAG
jgi:AcrR family transcriptional regulator